MSQQTVVMDAPASKPSQPLFADGRRRRVLVVASGGGHWVQMKRLWEAFSGHELIVATTDPGYEAQVCCDRFHVVTDANMQAKLRLARLSVEMAWIVLRERPEVVISTGAAPGYFALRYGKWIKAKTVWIDSLANAQQLSMSGQKVRPYADLWLTQWEHLAEPTGPYYYGSVA